MSLEGEIRVKVVWNGRRVAGVRIESTRPTAARLLEGRSPEEVMAFVPRVFSLCGSAQTAAAQQALAGAGAIVETEIRAVSDVILEIVHEYFWRLLIDWPRIVRHPIDAASVAEVRRLPTAIGGTAGSARFDYAQRSPAIGAALSTIATRSVFGMSPAGWLALHDLDELDAWVVRGATLPARLLGALLREMPGLGRSDVCLMPAATREALITSVLPVMSGNDDFERAPTWNGEPVETGALARMCSHPLVAALVARDGNTVAARMLARLCELALLLVECTANAYSEQGSAWVDGFRSGDNEGVGTVQTARGLLVHRVRLEGGRIADYRIVAPTEWNFHPEGALAHGLHLLDADDPSELERRTRLTVQGLDPCVACAIAVGHA